mgnify:FL=1
MTNNEKECSIDDCNNPHCARGFCKKHYARFMKHESPFVDLRKKETRNSDIKCIVENCNNFQCCRGYCQKHTNAIKQHGDPLYFDKIKSKQKYLREHSGHNSYYAMLWRISPDNKSSKKNYFDRGIGACKEWQSGGNGLENFINDMGEKPSKSHSLDRIDNDKGYSKENCRWATTSEQARNTRQTRMVMYQGKEICLKDFCEENGYEFNLIYRKVLRGMPLEEALVSKRYSHHHSIEINGVTGTLMYWSKIYGFSHTVASSKLKKGKTIESIIESSNKKRKELATGRASVLLEYNGRSKSICEWSKELNIQSQTIFNRYKRGYSIEDCLYQGRFHRNNNKKIK